MILLPSTRGTFSSSLRPPALTGYWTPPPPTSAGVPIDLCVGTQSGGLRSNNRGRRSSSSINSSNKHANSIAFPFSEVLEGLSSTGPAYLCNAQRGFATSPLNPHIHRGVLYPRVPQPYVLVVLLCTVPGVGAAGEVQYVRRGFFRHSLARQGWALPATWQNVDLVHSRLEQLRRRQQQQQQSQIETSCAPEKQRGVSAGEAETAANATEAGWVPGSDVPSDDEGQVLSWMRRLRLKFVVETEKTDGDQLVEPLSPQQVLQKLSKEEGMDLLPRQLRLLRRRRISFPHTQQNQQCDWHEELMQGRPLAPITHVGEYDIIAIIPTKSRPLARTFTVEVLSKT